MSYIILNGKKSTMVKGLMIQSLPPITKPLIRTRIEEIDGRDGDIITKLGYAAYDREMSIGLFGDYDIDEVIEYFNSEGEVVFSNELQKKYIYKILDRIDFERLGIFKQATVKFHVSPFKYSSANDTVISTDSQYVPVENKYARCPNIGNIFSKPQIYVYGCPSVLSISINRSGASTNDIVITDPTSPDIMIDLAEMNAYYISSSGEITGYANRVVSADYEAIKFETGRTIVRWSATVTKVEVYKISRWV